LSETIAELLAAEAKDLRFTDLPGEVVHQAKRSVLDGLGIGIGGFSSPPSRAVQSLINDMRAPEESTVLVSGVKTSCLYATLANGAMVRYLDYMDRTFLTKEAVSNMGHHGESVVPILAVGERQHASGQEVITAIVLAYELLSKITDSVGGNHGVLDKQGWVPESVRVPCVMALLAGRLLGLTKTEMANALSLAGCFTQELGILHSENEQLTMARNIRFPWAAHNGILAAFLVQKGFEGPLNVFEGHTGIAQVVAGGKMDLDKLRQPRTSWSILNTWIKNFSAEGRMHGHIEATLNLVQQHDIRPDDVAEVRIRVTEHCNRRMGNPETRRVPQTKYTADHSSYYCTAVAIIDRAVGPEQFTEEKLHDPRVQALADKVFVEADPKLEAYISPGIVDITTTMGQKYHAEVMRPKGHPMNPLTDADLEHKFRSLACTYMDDAQMTEIIRTVNDLDKLDDVGTLMKLLVAPAKHADVTAGVAS
jgi:2-methylcitrate dehydratase